ncbi:MAG: DUF2203 family protein [Chloroflexi bacterium]|nr:MAG: DUF2203 family protein [Chloroflexota bacterium]
MPERLYSVDEANALLPQVQPVLERIRQTEAVIAKDSGLAAVREKASQNGGGTPTVKTLAASRQLQKDLAQIAEWGIILRDPSIGLIDFLHERKGKTVCLCWKLGEPRVEWWHPIETGIAGRTHL